MKPKKTLLFLLVILFSAMPLGAVTDREMEQARTITAKAYLRYANNGSGYLDDISVSSMSELTSKLKAKEKENLKAFNNVKVPSDYAGWDKQKLLEYWGTTFFTSPGLDPSGKGARTRVRNQIGKMNIAAPAKEEKAPAPASRTQTAPAAAATPATPAPAQPSAPVTLTENPEAATPVANESVPEAPVETLETVVPEARTETEDIEEPREQSHTWVYVLVLAILVGVVIWLVVYAANMMKRQSASSDSESDSDEYEEEPREAPARRRIAPASTPEPVYIPPVKRTEDMRRVEETDRSENESLRIRLRAEESRNADLSLELEREKRDKIRLEDRMAQLRDENNRLLERLREAERQLARPEEPVRQPQVTDTVAVRQTPHDVTPQPPVRQQPVPQPPVNRVIYLGRANRRGIFVRADRRLSPGNTIYRLDTSDGLVGTFHVVDTPEVVDLAITSPVEFLAHGCTGEDFEDTAGVTHIVTESAGTAIFENSYWKVLRKSRVRYE